MDDRQAPLRSTRGNDPEALEAIDGFVIAVAERIDHMQDAEGSRDLSLLAWLADGLARDSLELGFEPLAQAAESVGDAARDGKSEEARRSLVELTELAQRVRRGHRGAF